MTNSPFHVPLIIDVKPAITERNQITRLHPAKDDKCIHSNDSQSTSDPNPPANRTIYNSINMVKLEQVAQNKAFGGSITKYKFVSEALGGLETNFNLFVPEGASSSAKVPVVTYLAGLTCNEDTAPWKAGLLLPASQHSLALLFPDTSPRGANIPTEDDSWDFGTGAGFYLNATAQDWSKNYNTERLITSEIQRVLKENSDVGGVLDLERQSVMGHSMGGHGAITLYLKVGLRRF
ncbi:S-formylglutathione hydrolase [Rhizoctonia solani AG-1 IB]|uniref:S-formylglutathione hydrolase n=1 Tax=Thanatephorus cucumeris (strain AG1-IB / isolate 7/3/14) TaxID=1108050 RepID=M5BN09_THACB|nr:S-formylglutathione hydrolase [Rhizoctonia solani AG-1 IB]